ncbi:MAG TPA: hypothetical protein VM577_10295 [Anaerovoracaceae bacterium]|nr:hypothetical protein [Anaerovoracaceae bacterium]
MDRQSRIFLMQKIAVSAGILTSFVEKNLGSSTGTGFKEQFLKTPPGPAREELIYNEIIKSGPPKQLIPVTVDGPNGTKITYNVMPDYVMLDGIRVTMAPYTAQKVADHFGMMLPTDKMSQQIYNAADTKVRANPLSSGGYTGADGKQYSAQDVIQHRIGAGDAALKYNDLTNQEIEKAKQSGKDLGLIAGHGKDILQPMARSNDPSIGGWHGKDGKALQPYGSPHKGEAGSHTEYGLYTRLIGNNAKVTMPDGRVVDTSVQKLLNDPEMAKILASKPGVNKYSPA